MKDQVTLSSTWGRRSALAAVLLSLWAGIALAQVANPTDGTTPPGIAPGAPAGSYPLTEFESFNPYSGNLSLRIPLLTMGGRGSVGHTLVLPIIQRWTVDKSYNIITGQPMYSPTDSWWFTHPGAFHGGKMLARRVSSPHSPCPPPPNSGIYTTTLTRITYSSPDGTEYEFLDASTGGGRTSYCANGSSKFNRGRVFKTDDGTAATFIASSDVYDATNEWDDFAGWTGGGRSAATCICATGLSITLTVTDPLNGSATAMAIRLFSATTIAATHSVH